MTATHAPLPASERRSRTTRPGLIARAMRSFFLWMQRFQWLARLSLHIPLLRQLPYRFIAGTNLDQAAAVIRQLNADGLMATLDVLGESVRDAEAATRAADEYVAAIVRIATRRLDANVSLKLTQMGLDLGTDVCLEAMRRVCEAGKRHNVFVRIDMESHDYTDRTLEIARTLRGEGYDVGVVIQSYLRRSKADVEQLAAERMRVRVCKGAYAESPEIAFQDPDEIGASYVDLCRRLLDADAYPGVATHDSAMIDAVAAYARERGIGPDRYEFQMLYGIRRDLQRKLVADGYRMRVYVPFGTEWFPYFMRRLAERPANVWFVARSFFGGWRDGVLTDTQARRLGRRYERALRAWAAGERLGTTIDARRANQLVRDAQRLQKRLRASAPGRAVIELLMADADPLVRLWAATHALHWAPERARLALEAVRDAAGEGADDARIVLEQQASGTLDLDW